MSVIKHVREALREIAGMALEGGDIESAAEAALAALERHEVVEGVEVNADGVDVAGPYIILRGNTAPDAGPAILLVEKTND